MIANLTISTCRQDDCLDILDHSCGLSRLLFVLYLAGYQRFLRPQGEPDSRRLPFLVASPNNGRVHSRKDSPLQVQTSWTASLHEYDVVLCMTSAIRCSLDYPMFTKKNPLISTPVFYDSCPPHSICRNWRSNTAEPRMTQNYPRYACLHPRRRKNGRDGGRVCGGSICCRGRRLTTGGEALPSGGAGNGTS